MKIDKIRSKKCILQNWGLPLHIIHLKTNYRATENKKSPLIGCMNITEVVPNTCKESAKQIATCYTC